MFIFMLVFIAKVASQEVHQKRVVGSLGAAYINAQVLKPLFLKLLATFQNDRTNAIIDVHKTLLRVASREQCRETYAVAAVPLILFFDHYFWHPGGRQTTKTASVHQTVYFKRFGAH